MTTTHPTEKKSNSLARRKNWLRRKNFRKKEDLNGFGLIARIVHILSNAPANQEKIVTEEQLKLITSKVK